MPLVRRCFAVDLHDDPELIAAYRKWHEPGGPPPAVNAAIRVDGVESLEIWLVGDRMFMVMELDPDRAPGPETKRARDAANPVHRLNPSYSSTVTNLSSGDSVKINPRNCTSCGTLFECSCNPIGPL